MTSSATPERSSSGAKGTTSIFISYRRSDSADAAGRLYDILAGRFGRDQIFMDVDTIAPGADFVDAIDRAVGACDSVVALIGTRWLIEPDATGRPRLENAHDYVRLEIEAALKSGARVIPVLIHGAEMPTASDLPASMKDLARRNAMEVRHTTWRDDVERLIRTLEKEPPTDTALTPEVREVVEKQPAIPMGSGRNRRIAAILAGVAGLLLIAFGIGAFLLARSGNDGTAPAEGHGSIAVVLLDERSSNSDPVIALVDPENGAIVRLRSSDGSLITGYGPRWLPDGRLAFDRRAIGDAPRLAIDLDDLVVQHLAEIPNSAQSWDWSAQGLIAYVTATQNETCLSIRAADITSSTRMSQYCEATGAGGWISGDIGWSPNGSSLAYTDVQGQLFIVVIDARGLSDPRPISDVQIEGYDWSPDGASLVYAAKTTDDGTFDLFTVPVDIPESRPLPLYGTAHEERYPTWLSSGDVVFLKDDSRLEAVPFPAGAPARPIASTSPTETFQSPTWGTTLLPSALQRSAA